MSSTDKWQSLVKEITVLLVAQNKTVAVAESCTGGSISTMLTFFAGSSNFFAGGVIAYSNKVKVNLLAVQQEDLVKYSAVSEQVAKQMADGVRRQLQSDYAIATTGYAGPDGDKVGQVFLAFSSKEKHHTTSHFFEGEREEIVNKASVKVLRILLSEIKK